MDTNVLNRHFERMGARLKFEDRPRRNRLSAGLMLDVGNDRDGEYFAVVAPSEGQAELAVLDVQPRERHLLLLIREGDTKSKFLCGHDERHWFVAGIPEAAPVGTVRQAKEALKPPAVQSAQAKSGLSGKARNRRKNAAYVRQGEWFFLPVPSLVVDKKMVLRNEPLSRGNGSKLHWVDFCYRSGGDLVYVCGQHPAGVSAAQYQRILSRNNAARGWGWRPMRRNPDTCVKGRIRHTDHATITPHEWHRVWMNTEGQSRAMRHVAFHD